MSRKTAKELGAEAAMQMGSMAQNPYEKGSVAAQQWESGFQWEQDNAYDTPGFYFDENDNIRNIDFYVTKACDHLGKKDYRGNFHPASERELSRELGKAENVVNNWLSNKTKPSPDAIVTLSRIAKENPYKALLELNIWTSEGEVQHAYKMILKKITAVIFLAFLLIGHPANAAPSRGGLVSKTITGIYIITSDFISRIRKTLRKALFSLRIHSIVCPYYGHRARV